MEWPCRALEGAHVKPAISILFDMWSIFASFIRTSCSSLRTFFSKICRIHLGRGGRKRAEFEGPIKKQNKKGL